MKKSLFSTILFCLAFFAQTFTASAQSFIAVGGGVGANYQSKKFALQTQNWNGHVDIRQRWFRFGLDARQFTPQKGSLYQKASQYTAETGFALGTISLLGSGTYRSDATDAISRSALYAGGSIDWLQPLRNENGAFAFFQVRAGYQWGLDWQKTGNTPYLPENANSVTLRFGVKLLPLGEEAGLYPYLEFSQFNIGQENTLAAPAGSYLGIGIKIFAFSTRGRGCRSGWLPREAFGVRQDQSRVRRRARY